ncbi:hypothetical protein MMC13_001097 [Lambiella insularis]|nr:hypothetical protein [Lambiella insularis]
MDPNSSVLAWNQHEAFFNYTRARFVCNEEFEMAQRHVRFDMDKLAQIAATAIGSKSCVAVEKYPDGQYSKAFLMTMDDGKQVVAKVPNPNAGPAHLTTASEVATMEFARTVLETPVPKIYSWSSEAQNNAAGAEYIIMEKAPGVQLAKVWKTMNMKERLGVVKQILNYQKNWTYVSFEQFGSLYFSHDLGKQISQQPLYLDQHGKAVKNERFVVGPSIGREYYDAGRAMIKYDRGPWNSVEDYLAAIGNREINCINKMPQLPKSPIMFAGPGTYMASREKKLKALQSYLAIYKYLLPVDRSMTSSHLWHPDLHQENIFVNPEKPSEIVAIIDWQSTELAPLFNQAGEPYFLDYEGPPTHGLEDPKLPENYKELEGVAKKEAMATWLCQVLSVMHRVLLRNKARLLYQSWEYRETTSFELLLLAQRLLIDGEAQYQNSILELESVWSELPGVIAHGSPPYPFSFSPAERKEIKADINGAVEGMRLMECVKHGIGRELFPERGVVMTDRYDKAKNALRQAKEQLLESYAKDDSERKLWEGNWLFDD